MNTVPSITYLDAVGGNQSMQVYKRLSYDLLDLAPGYRVLDVGCGMGDDVRALASRIGPDGKVTGVDKDFRMIAEAWRRSSTGSPSVEFRVGEASRLGFNDCSFHGCRSERLLQHVESPANVLAEMVRVTKSGGKIVIGEPDWDTLVVDAEDRRVTGKIIDFICEKLVCNPDVGRRLRALLLKAGLSGVKVAGVVVMLNDLGVADQTWGLRPHSEMARKAGAISAAELSTWLGSLAARQESGTFFAACLGFLALGTK